MRGFRQGDLLSCDLFNCGECSAKGWIYRNDTTFQKSIQLLAYADNIDIIGRTKRDVTAAFSATERESTKMSRAVNEGKTNYILSTNKDVWRIDYQITADNYSFDTVKEFIYLGSTVTTKNDVSLEIKRRITLANRCYCDVNGQLSNRDLSRTMKLIIYKTLILPELFYGAEAWTVLNTDAAASRVFEIKDLPKIFGPVCVGDVFRIRYNSKMYDLLNDLDAMQRSIIQSLVLRRMLQRCGDL